MNSDQKRRRTKAYNIASTEQEKKKTIQDGCQRVSEPHRRRRGWEEGREKGERGKAKEFWTLAVVQCTTIH